MRRRSPLRAATVALVLVVVAGACSHGHGHGAARSTSTTATSVLPNADDAGLRATQVQAGDLGTGYLQDTSSNNTVTSFCFGQDAAQGLRATARAYVGYGRSPAGAAVLQLTFRFAPGDAARFVAQADQMFSTCSGVPDIQGHAFTYQPTTAAVDGALAATDAHTSRFGVSVGNGNLTEEAAFFHRGDIGVLIAVVTNQLPRADTDALATTAFAAAVRRAPSR